MLVIRTWTTPLLVSRIQISFAWEYRWKLSPSQNNENLSYVKPHDEQYLESTQGFGSPHLFFLSQRLGTMALEGKQEPGFNADDFIDDLMSEKSKAKFPPLKTPWSPVDLYPFLNKEKNLRQKY